MINETELNLFENFYEEEEEQKKTNLDKVSNDRLGKKRNRETSIKDETAKTDENNEQNNQDYQMQDNENNEISEISDNENQLKVNKKDYTIEEKLKRILDGDNNDNAECDEFKVTSYNFNGMIHDIITPKNYEKECKE
jgi:hypothetical protein